MRKWRLISDDNLDGKTNMAIDLAITMEAGQDGVLPILRFYGWKSPTLSLGYSQRETAKINISCCRKNNIDVVCRPTGGKAVLHDQELTYAFAASNGNHLFPSSLTGRYKIINRALISGLNNLGIAEIQESNKKYNPRSDDCFLTLGASEINIGGKKLIGSAQRKYARSFLQHGSILLDWNMELHQEIFSTPIKDQEKYFTALNRLSPRQYTVQEVREAMIEGFKKEFSVEFI